MESKTEVPHGTDVACPKETFLYEKSDSINKFPRFWDLSLRSGVEWMVLSYVYITEIHRFRFL